MAFAGSRMKFSDSEDCECFSVVLPMSVNLKNFLLLLEKRYKLDVALEIVEEKRPLRLRGKVALETSLFVRGRDRKEYIKNLQREVEDYIEASGYIA